MSNYKFLANKLAEEKDADIFLFNGGVDSPADREVWHLCQGNHKRSNAIVYLCTFGGNPDVAYRIARYFQQNYNRLTVNVHGFCKSAGTLIAIGANEIVMSETGELGPLDAQIAKVDDIATNSSGLNIDEALDKLQEKSFDSLEHYFLPIVSKSGGRISTKMAMKIATDLVIGLYGKIYEHIDPLQVGETNRAMKIAMFYGKKLNQTSGILKENALDQLVSYYCDHGFVIDLNEAMQLFNAIRKAGKLETDLAQAIGNFSTWPTGDEHGEPLVTMLSDAVGSTQNENQEEKNDGKNKARSPHRDSSSKGSSTSVADEKGPRTGKSAQPEKK